MSTGKVVVRINCFLQIVDDVGTDFRDRSDARQFAQVNISHPRSELLKLLTASMIRLPQQDLLSRSQFRSRDHSRRRPKPHPPLLSRTHASLLRKDSQLTDNPQQALQIYFNQHKRKQYLRGIVDNYFQTARPQPAAASSFVLSTPSAPRDTFSSDSSHRLSQRKRSSLLLDPPQEMKLSLSKTGTYCERNPLPIIEEMELTKRPQSEYREVRKRDEETDGSFFIQSNKSLEAGSSMVESRHYDSEIQMRSEYYRMVVIRREGRKIGRLKVFEKEGEELLARELMAKKMGMDMMWRNAQRQRMLQFPLMKNLREMCFSLIEDKKGDETIFLLYPSQYYNNLFANQNEELIDIINCFAQQIAKGAGSVGNHQLNIQNIYKLTEKRYLLGDWSCSSSQQHIDIQGRRITKKLNPLPRINGKWLTIPEYLSPQILRAQEEGDYESIWSQKGGVGTSDVWSLGCLLFELITLVPLWISYQCVIKGRTQGQRGLFACKQRTIPNILLKQRNFKNVSLRLIKEECKVRPQLSINPKLLSLLPRLLEENPERRITPSQILAHLK